jgi:hypothetical protein
MAMMGLEAAEEMEEILEAQEVPKRGTIKANF